MNNHHLGIIGLGVMGMPIARHLQNAGHTVHAYDPSPVVASEASASGLLLEPHPAAVAAATDASFVIVGFDDQVRDVCLNESTGIVVGAGAGHTVFICSTVHPDLPLALDDALATLGVSTVDAPLCRSHHAALDGTLLMLTGGDAAVVDRWRPVMAAFASDIVHVGSLGSGQMAKAVNNMLLWVAVAANSEAIRLGSRFGMDAETLRTAILAGSGGNWALETWNRARPMPWAEDDLEIVQEVAARFGIEMPMLSTAAPTIAAIKRDKADRSLASASMADYLKSDSIRRTDPD